MDCYRGLDPLVEYLPITGGEVTGPLLVNDLLEVKEDRVEYQKNRTSISQMTSREIINAGILDNLMRAPIDGYLKDYLPLAGGDMVGDVKFKDAVKPQMGGTYNNNIIDGKVGFTDNSLVPTLGYVKHAINALGDSVGEEEGARGFRKQSLLVIKTGTTSVLVSLVR